MTHDPVIAYRAELRSAAVRRARRYKLRRRLTASVAIALGAFLLVGAAIAAQRTWFDEGGTGQVRILHSEDEVVSPSDELKSCLQEHGAGVSIATDRGVVFRDASAAMTECGAFATSITLSCDPSPAPASKPMNVCVVRAEWIPGLNEGDIP